MELHCRHNDKVISNLLISEEEEDIFSLARAAKPRATAVLSAGDESSTPVTDPPSLALLDMCKCTHIDIPWTAAVVKASRSCYGGKKLPLARIWMKEHFPIFPELL